jgi:sucrose-6-phosphate hydrolase SacC (GH32 family)
MNSFHGGDASTGTLTSPPFTITRPYLSFLVAGGSTHLTRLELIVGDGVVVHSGSGDDSETLKWQSWDVSALMGLQAVLRAVDEATGAWGHLNLDHIVMGDAPVAQPDMADITLWADHGRDFYAPITFANLPDGRVLWMGWMNNWDYGRVLPTEPWRGQQSSPRELDLVTTPRGLRLRQKVAEEVRGLLGSQPLLSLQGVSAQAAAGALAAKGGLAASGRQLMAVLVVDTAGLQAPVGLELFKGAAEAVRVGYDPLRRTFFVDRSTLTPKFAGQSERHDAARLMSGDAITLEVWVDGSTLELFADGGTVVISDLVYADPSATGVGLFHGADNPEILSLELRSVRASIEF